MPISTHKISDKHQLARLLLDDTVVEFPHSLILLAIDQLLGPLLLHNVTKTKSIVNDSVQMRALTADARERMILYLLQERAMFEVNQAITAAGIQCVWLKGTSLGHTVYPEPQLRVKGDLDCIVPLEDFPIALDILLSMNYVLPENMLKTVAHDRLSHHTHLIHSHYPQLHLELHHRLLGHSGENDLPREHLAAWLDQSITFEVNQQTFFTFKPEHHVLYLCAHGFLQHGEAFVGLRDLLDLHLLITTYNLDWELLVTEVIDLKWTFLVNYVLNRVQEYFDTAIPLDVFDTLQAYQTTDESIDRIVLKRHGNIRGESVLQLLGQLTLREKARTLYQIILPPRDYMRQRYAIPPNHLTLPYYGYRLLYQSKGFVVAILRRLSFYLRSIFQSTDI
jgi:hypothetical protein